MSTDPAIAILARADAVLFEVALDPLRLTALSGGAATVRAARSASTVSVAPSSIAPGITTR